MKSLNRKDLYDLVWQIPISRLAKKFEITDNELRNLCKKHTIPTPEMGYWQKLQFGKEIEKKSLPESESDEIIEISSSRKKSDDLLEVSLKEKILNSKLLTTAVPELLKNPDKITVITQKVIYEKQNDEWGKRSKTVSVYGSAPRVEVSKIMVPRVLKVLDVLIKNFRTMKYDITIEDKGMFISSGDEKMELYFRERNVAKTIVNKYGRSERELSLTGKLVVKIRFWWRIYEFVDDKNKQIEVKISDILTKIETLFQEEHEQKRIRKIEQDRRDAERKIEEEKQKVKEEELRKFIAFYDSAHRWKEYMILKEYFDALQESGTEDVEKLRWMNEKLEWYNPMTNIEDELLKYVNKKTLKFDE